MIGKIGLSNIEPGKPYLAGATGPLRGARLLFLGDLSARADLTTLESLSITFGASLGVGMQVVEDALCNWQKSPNAFKAFRG
jgi:hypothetical protein